MQVRCPHCKNIFEAAAPGLQACPSCGQQINVPAPAAAGPAAGTALCAIHRERPATGTCSRCGNFTCDECSQGGTVLCPTCRAQVGAAAVQREPTPWERRSELGLPFALWQTWKRAMFEPDRFWRSVQPGAPTSEALYFGWLLTVIAAVPSFFVNWLNFASIRKQLDQALSQMNDVPPELERWIDAISSNAALFAGAAALFSVVLYPLSLLIGSALTHLGALVFGSAKNGFGATMRVLAYASAPAVVAWIPMVGAAAALYILVLEVWGLARVQESSVGRSIGAVLFIPVLVWCCCLPLTFVALYNFFSAAR